MSDSFSLYTVSGAPADTLPRPDVSPILVDARRAARLLGIGLRTFRTMDAAGRLPAPVRLSRGCVRWRLAELLDWTEAGCPDREAWAALRASRK